MRPSACSDTASMGDSVLTPESSVFDGKSCCPPFGKTTKQPTRTALDWDGTWGSGFCLFRDSRLHDAGSRSQDVAAAKSQLHPQQLTSWNGMERTLLGRTIRACATTAGAVGRHELLHFGQLVGRSRPLLIPMTILPRDSGHGLDMPSRWCAHTARRGQAQGKCSGRGRGPTKRCANSRDCSRAA